MNILLHIPTDDEMQSHPLLTVPSMDALTRAAGQLSGKPMRLRATLTHLNTPYGFIGECNIFSLTDEAGEYNMDAHRAIVAFSEVMMMFQGDVVIHFSKEVLVV